MIVEERLALAARLGNYMKSNDADWQAAKQRAFAANQWFIPEFIDRASIAIATQFLHYGLLKNLATDYGIEQQTTHPKNVGIVAAGNIPLVGFHDVLCTFISGHYARIKTSSKDAVLIKHLIEKMVSWNAAAAPYFSFQDLLKGCDAYIATGGNNTGRYFEFYFKNKPSIIRRARTSVAVLTGHETAHDLEKLADDVHLYFGLGCRNVTKIFVPEGYAFVPLLEAFKKFQYLIDHNKYKNNYDYNLALLLLNNSYYMTNGSILLVESEALFSPISQLHYQYYGDLKKLQDDLKKEASLQCAVGKGFSAFGSAQQPCLTDFADGIDTMAFLKSL